MVIFVNHDDLRSLELMEELIKRGYYVSDELSDMKYSKVIYLGMKGIDRKHRLLFGKETIVLDEKTFRELPENCLIITMVYNDYLDELSKQYHFCYRVLLTDENYIYKNSLLTAEGLISYLISHRRMPLYQSRILVLGFGHCAKPIVRYLKAFQSDVDVGLRNRQLDKEVKKLGASPYPIDTIKWGRYDIIINTVPSCIIDHKAIDCMSKQVMIVDIASYPYGLDHHYALSCGLNALILPSIPNKYAYGYAGKMICDEIERVLENG